MYSSKHLKASNLLFRFLRRQMESLSNVGLFFFHRESLSVTWIIHVVRCCCSDYICPSVVHSSKGAESWHCPQGERTAFQPRIHDALKMLPRTEACKSDSFSNCPWWRHGPLAASPSMNSSDNEAFPPMYLRGPRRREGRPRPAWVMTEPWRQAMKFAQARRGTQQKVAQLMVVESLFWSWECRRTTASGWSLQWHQCLKAESTSLLSIR